jgi:hypothetical protein
MEIINHSRRRCSSPPGSVHAIQLPRADEYDYNPFYVFIPDDLNPDNARFLTKDEYMNLSRSLSIAAPAGYVDDDMSDDDNISDDIIEE